MTIQVYQNFVALKLLHFIITRPAENELKFVDVKVYFWTVLNVFDGFFLFFKYTKL